MRPERLAVRVIRAAVVAAMALVLATILGCATAAENSKPAEPPKAVSLGPAKTETEPGAWSPPTFTARQDERDRMCEVIKAYGCTDAAVLAAMAAVPRHEFVPATVRPMAYRDSPLPIGHEQTISQPYMVAEMTRLLALKPGGKVLEIGTGSGYQAAVLTHFTPHVYSIEIVKPLAEEAAKRLGRLRYDVVQVRYGDGYNGWPEAGPFDAIIGTCVAGEVPPPLIEQLKVGGRMVIPIGPEHGIQRLMLVEKDRPGLVRKRSIMLVRFVPMLREDPTQQK